jgi:hypothetical protein
MTPSGLPPARAWGTHDETHNTRPSTRAWGKR